MKFCWEQNKEQLIFHTQKKTWTRIKSQMFNPSRCPSSWVSYIFGVFNYIAAFFLIFKFFIFSCWKQFHIAPKAFEHGSTGLDSFLASWHGEVSSPHLHISCLRPVTIHFSMKSQSFGEKHCLGTKMRIWRSSLLMDGSFFLPGYFQWTELTFVFLLKRKYISRSFYFHLLFLIRRTLAPDDIEIITYAMYVCLYLCVCVCLRTYINIFIGHRRDMSRLSIPMTEGNMNSGA